MKRLLYQLSYIGIVTFFCRDKSVKEIPQYLLKFSDVTSKPLGLPPLLIPNYIRVAVRTFGVVGILQVLYGVVETPFSD